MTITIVDLGYLDDGPYLDSLPYMGTAAQGGVGSELHGNPTKPIGQQINALHQGNVGMQWDSHRQDGYGMQFLGLRGFGVGMQFLATLYNATNLRIMCEFLSRGSPIVTGGNNVFGNPIGTGQNWLSNSTAPGDFSVFNLNTDIVEQVWRSAQGVVTGIQLTMDAETSSIFMDTFAILNHNISRSAVVNLLGSDDPTFATVGKQVTLQMTEDSNRYHVEEFLPQTGFRYWRLLIDDATNPDGFIKIGTILLGRSRIFQGECFVDQIQFELRDFADTVRTEGFTNVANSRSQKRFLGLEFRSLFLVRRNFQILRDIFTNQRTVLKCLWIPTPSVTDPEITGRYAVFAKLVKIPRETHNNKGPDATYVTFPIELDESL